MSQNATGHDWRGMAGALKSWLERSFGYESNPERVRYVRVACAFLVLAMAAFALFPDAGPAAPVGWMLRVVGVFFALFFAVLAYHAPHSAHD